MAKPIAYTLDEQGFVTSITPVETGTPVDLTRLTPNERAACLIVATLDRHHFDGKARSKCVLGQPSRALGMQVEPNQPWQLREYVFLAERTGADADLLYRIYCSAEDFGTDADAALAMTAAALGVDLARIARMVGLT